MRPSTLPASLTFIALISFALVLVVPSVPAQACDPAVGKVTLTKPLNGAAVVAQVSIDAVSDTSCATTGMQVYVDGRLQLTQFKQAFLQASVPVPAGKHWIQVKAWNSAGKAFVADTIILVTAVLPPVCSAPRDNWVWVCGPAEYSRANSPVLVTATVRADSATVTEAKVWLNDQLRVRLYGSAARQISVKLKVEPGLIYADVVGSIAGVGEVHNATIFIVKSNAPCATPVLNVMVPGDDPGGPPLGQPIIYLAYADAGQCPITTMKVYVDGRPQYSAFGQSIITGRMRMEPGVHQVTVQAWNSHGQVGKRTVWVNAEYNPEAYCVPERTWVMLCHGGDLRIGPLVGWHSRRSADSNYRRAHLR